MKTRLEIIPASELKPGDRFAKKDWHKTGERTVLEFTPPRKNWKKRVTIDVHAEGSKDLFRLKKTEFVYRITPI